MLVLAFLAATATVDSPASLGGEAVQQARATVRIVSGVRVTAEDPPQEALVRDLRLESDDGSQTTKRLIEFP